MLKSKQSGYKISLHTPNKQTKMLNFNQPSIHNHGQGEPYTGLDHKIAFSPIEKIQSNSFPQHDNPKVIPAEKATPKLWVQLLLSPSPPQWLNFCHPDLSTEIQGKTDQQGASMFPNVGGAGDQSALQPQQLRTAHLPNGNWWRRGVSVVARRHCKDACYCVAESRSKSGGVSRIWGAH